MNCIFCKTKLSEMTFSSPNIRWLVCQNCTKCLPLPDQPLYHFKFVVRKFDAKIDYVWVDLGKLILVTNILTNTSTICNSKGIIIAHLDTYINVFAGNSKDLLDKLELYVLMS